MPNDDLILEPSFGTLLPRLATDEIPGPESRRLAERLARVESRNITRLEGELPIFWAAARGSNVLDVDGNTLIDLTAGFGVAAAGHANPAVAAAVAHQAANLAHGLGDVYPPEIKVQLLERLAEVAPGDLGISILSSAGAEAIEAALKTAIVYTGNPGVIAFIGSYHGLTYGALSTTWNADFRDPFQPQIYGGVHFAPYPHTYHSTPGSDPTETALAEVERIIRAEAGSETAIGAILVEPIQGRGGIVVPPPEFLPRLRQIADHYNIPLIFDEIYTGFGRTGRWFASEHWGVVPDLMTVGKALTGMLPLSAAIGRPEIMEAWPPSKGEAIHTSTFLGNPIACAAALANLNEIERLGLVDRAARLGEQLRKRLELWRDRYSIVGDLRGLGLMQGVELVKDRDTREPATEEAGTIVANALRRGLIMLGEGPSLNILAIVPPLTITEEQLDHTLDILEEEIVRVTG